MMTEQSKWAGDDVIRFTYGRPRHHGRESVTQDLDPRIHMPIRCYDGEDIEGELALTVPQALEVIELLTVEVRSLIRRRDIAEALTRTEPLLHV